MKTEAKKEVKKETKKEVKKAPAKKTAPKKTTKAVSKTTATKKKENKIIQTENNYGRTILAAILIIVVLIGGYLAVQNKKHSGEEKFVQTADEKKFKKEFETLNGKDGIVKVSIEDNNNMKYTTLEDAYNIIDSKSGIIYFGYAECNECRNFTKALIEASNDLKIDTINYINIKDLRDEYTLDNKNKARKTTDASETYYNILTSLANELDDYILVTKNDKKVSTGEKRIVAPTIVVVKDGEVVGFYQGKESKENKELTKEEYNALVKKLKDILKNA